MAIVVAHKLSARKTQHIIILAFGAVLSLTLLFAQVLQSKAHDFSNDFAILAERLSPAVVNVTTATKLVRPAAQNRPRFPKNSPFEDFFNDFFENLPNTQQAPGDSKRARAVGSGFVISQDGFIVTNNHVIDKADEIKIEFLDGTRLEAELIGRDINTDIALLKVKADKPLAFVTFGDSDVARVGDWVMAIGNPLGQGFSVSAGIISARNRVLNAGPYDDFIQTDAAINRGNSGGPLFNIDGDVIGVNTAIISPTGGSVGLGFAMSSRVVEQVVDQLIEFGETRRGWLGVEIQAVDSELADALGLSEVSGALVNAVTDGPSKNAGMKAGDVILNFDGKKIQDERNLINVVGRTKIGKSVRVVILRNGQEKTLNVTLGRREDAERALSSDSRGETQEPAKNEVLGITLGMVTPDARAELNLPADINGVIIFDIDESSDAFEKGLRRGDVIAEVNQQPVASPSDVTVLLNDSRDAGRSSALLTVTRGKDRRFFVGLALEG